MSYRLASVVTSRAQTARVTAPALRRQLMEPDLRRTR